MRSLNSYSAERYVIGCRSPSRSSKLFQIAFAKSDASLFVAFPYMPAMAGRVGHVTLPPNMQFPSGIDVGSEFPVTAHSVKYSHHPTGEAHFSLSGKVRTQIRKSAVPLHGAGGHLFTVMAQGLHRFERMTEKDVGTAKRGVVTFDFTHVNLVAIKFVAHLYSLGECSWRFPRGTSSPWVAALLPDGRRLASIVLATPYRHNGEPYFLALTAEDHPLICATEEVWLSLTGGFDSPAVALDHGKGTSFLMCFYASSGNVRSIAEQFGSIDLTPQTIC